MVALVRLIGTKKLILGVLAHGLYVVTYTSFVRVILSLFYKRLRSRR